MNRILFFVLMVVGLAACRSENKQITSEFIHFPPSSGASSDEKVPVISFDSSTVNFGTLAIGATFDHTFRFTNTGQAPLSLTQVSPSCGCTVPRSWPREPIQPGQTGEISVTFNSKGNTGAIEKSITVVSNCIPAANKLVIKGNVLGVESVNDQKPSFEMEMEKR